MGRRGTANPQVQNRDEQTEEPYAELVELKDVSVEFEPGSRSSCDRIGQHGEQSTDETEKDELMLTVKGPIDEPRETTFDGQRAHQVSHQAPDRCVTAERYE